LNLIASAAMIAELKYLRAAARLAWRPRIVSRSRGSFFSMPMPSSALGLRMQDDNMV